MMGNALSEGFLYSTDRHTHSLNNELTEVESEESAFGPVELVEH
jgi:hypothetical protein